MPRHPVLVYFGDFSPMSNDNIFSKEQEDQLRIAFDALNKELGLDKLDDEQALEDLMARIRIPKQLELFPISNIEVEANRLVISFSTLTDEVAKLEDTLTYKNPKQLRLFSNL